MNWIFFNQPRGNLGEIGAARFSAPVQGVALQKEAVFFGGLLILGKPVFGLHQDFNQLENGATS